MPAPGKCPQALRERAMRLVAQRSPRAGAGAQRPSGDPQDLPACPNGPSPQDVVRRPSELRQSPGLRTIHVAPGASAAVTCTGRPSSPKNQSTDPAVASADSEGGTPV